MYRTANVHIDLCIYAYGLANVWVWEYAAAPAYVCVHMNRYAGVCIVTSISIPAHLYSHMVMYLCVHCCHTDNRAGRLAIDMSV